MNVPMGVLGFVMCFISVKYENVYGVIGGFIGLGCMLYACYLVPSYVEERERTERECREWEEERREHRD